ncbi:MAG: hypothetical protein A2Y25_05705 [Candidatus Melainabacteria bacterium GWF2_37_15]|nr:MAG: hypothetical protein A2Y25_05705 [Candidatus Melainabacteria bacterium GWF2_37_15]
MSIKLDPTKIRVEEKGKNKKVIYKDFDFYSWPYEGQTKIKHFVFEEYFKVWTIILGTFNNKINYFDGFGGCGAYIDEEKNELHFGSPILAANIKENSVKLSSKINIVVIEENQEAIDNLKKVIKHNKLNPFQIIQGDFDIEVNKFLDKLEKSPTPTFFMIDPFGISVKYETLKRIMSIPKTEILFNFMYNTISRFLTVGTIEKILDELFGCDEWKNLRELQEEEKEKGVTVLFRDQLKKFSDYVYQYRLSFQDKKRTYYYLFHLTNNVKGCSIMKSAFAKFNFGNVAFLGPNQPNPNQSFFLDPSDLKKLEAKTYLEKKYKEKEVTYFNILKEVIDETPFLEKHIRSALKEMEKENKVIIQRIPEYTGKDRKRKRTGLEDKDIIHFN